ncbi:hypothetical protein BaRGS_00019185 [Batillaria attramentaria]|uniref:Uncharacterized protein n=1 Tax=Batillaria attramentaria TaxID=370345 RepID=A0ABD0KQJ4_9CAEN
MALLHPVTNRLSFGTSRPLLYARKMSWLRAYTYNKCAKTATSPVRAFAARLRGQAGVCNIRVKCPSLDCHAEVDYSNIMILDVLIRGLEDEEIRLDILGESRQDMSLEDTLRYVEAKESGKSVCRQTLRRPSNPAPSSSPNAVDDSSAVFDNLCSVTEDMSMSHDTNSVSLDHHVYNEFCRRGNDGPRIPQPFYGAYKKSPPPSQHEDDCSPTGATIDIIGALALRISGTSPSKNRLATHQMVYFTTATDRMFLSKQACVALGMLPPAFLR